jgi:hypothetical protein
MRPLSAATVDDRDCDGHTRPAGARRHFPQDCP